MTYIDLLDSNLEQTIRQPRKPPLLVLFRKTPCEVCDLAAKWVDELAEAFFKQKVRLARMDVEANPVTRDRLPIEGVPKLVLFKGKFGNRKGFIGPWAALQDKDALHVFLKKHLR